MAYLKILRPFNCLFVAICVLFGIFFRNLTLQSYYVFFAILSATIIAGAGYVINDFFDLPIDSVNKPNRILPSEKIKPKSAYLYAVFLFILGIILSFLTRNIYCVIIALINSILLFFYAKTFKMNFLIGNLVVAYAAGSTFIFGGLSSNNFFNSLIIAIYAFLYTLMREFIKDAEDIEGDIKFNAKTLAIKLGREKTIFTSILPVALIIVFTIYLFFSEFILLSTFVLMNVFVSIPLIFFIIFLSKKISLKKLSLVSGWMKIDMLILLIILWFGK